MEGFDANTFMYAEEMILSEKLSKISAHMYYYNMIKIIHGHEIDKSNKKTNIVNKKRMYESCRYYYGEYRSVPEIFLKLSDLLFGINIYFRKLI